MPSGKFTRYKPVYDIKDVEHGNKFMVRPAGGGAPQIVHNCSQHAAGAVFNDMMVRIERRATEIGGLFCGDVHDEMIYRAPVGRGGEVLKIMQEEMKVPPVWWPELPVTSEGEHGFGILETDTGFTMASRYGMLK